MPSSYATCYGYVKAVFYATLANFYGSITQSKRLGRDAIDLIS
jgi:hypothetical protein